ncbi:DEAD/DEAH box helicase [Cereibacter sphaeroides]|uniref:DEAD/DEAH box helicase n=1 Tax=Cereibacter sphaeroides TaxID=1063 RepID=UPI00006653CF|nr:DEAD/DEAH box helicase domain protein [Cereibacter sphaeroides ATCC 17029]
MPNEATLALARDIRDSLAGSRLSPLQAKLYSQRIRRDMGRDGLASFTADELVARLDEAMLLLETAWIERSAGGDEWKPAVKRAAEILEWLSQSSLRPEGVPTHLLSAAAYQLAGYPAMALGHLRYVSTEDSVSNLLRPFLRADFSAALSAVQTFWAAQMELGLERTLRPETVEIDGRSVQLVDLEIASIRHVVMCIGTICAYMRTGDDALVERALSKLDALAAGFLHSRDPYSYLLARLTAANARVFVETSLWPQIKRLANDASPRASAALVQFARAAFANRRALVWPAQAEGVRRLAEDDSFVLCTPTGSGKTTIATLGAVQGLFAERADAFSAENLVLYLVPSRALAAEVETRLAEDLRGVAAEPVVVTGLYGGTDWGPTDAWVQVDQPTVVICTFEKADALLRYLGVLFLDRVRLVVIDEAHMVEQDPKRVQGLSDGTSRSLRLEQLSARLLRAKEEKGFRVIALSAVAAKAAPAIASWLAGDAEAGPVTSTHRSTRQMLGRLEVTRSGRFDIRYDLMDGRTLEFEDERTDDRPYVPQPFRHLPGGIDTEAGPEVRIRAPTLWAALHLAAERPDGTKPSVLVSLTQSVSTFAATCADLMEKWADEELPNYWSIDEEDPHWKRCLAAAEDYFTRESAEYRLLSKGVAVHHGQMPPLLARRLKVAIDRGQVRVVIATSTLSEGVNMPVNTLLIPSVCRADDVMPVNEFANLIGRAGRPGVATEGSVLVVLPEREYESRRGRQQPVWNRQWNGYDQLVRKLQEATELAVSGAMTSEEGEAHSPLALLLEALREAWEEISDSDDDDEFLEWLDKTAIIEAKEDEENAVALLDTLDGLLIAALQEVELLLGRGLEPAEIEGELQKIWQRTYAYVAANEQARLARSWLARGQAIAALYPDPTRRRQLYKTSLAPRSGEILLDRIDEIRGALIDGQDYASRPAEARFDFVRSIIKLLSEIPAFRIGRTLGRKRTFDEWETVLRWWLFKPSVPRQPPAKELGNWFKFVSDNFIYRGSWGLGSTIGVLLDRDSAGQPLDAMTIDDWPNSGLPWIAFWLKELISWGTLDPVAAFLLARGDAVDRPEAERDALDYYASRGDSVDPNEMLDPRAIRAWLDERRPTRTTHAPRGDLAIDVRLALPASDYLNHSMSVLPLLASDGIHWIDPAGYVVANSDLPDEWSDQGARYHFELSVVSSSVLGEPYLRHRES